MQSKDNLNEELATIYSRVSLQCKSYIDSDPLVTRQDTCKGLLALLQQLKSILTTVNSMKVEERARHYNVTYNAISYISDIAEYLRRTNFSFEIIPILIDSIKSMEDNIILNDVKYLDKRTELYLKASKIYEEWEYYQEAVSILDNAIKSYKNIKTIHQQDPPVPNYILGVLNNNIKLIKIFFIKYSIQAGSFPPGDWKKKADEQFGDDSQAKLMCLVQSLKTQTKKHSNIFAKNMKNYKQNLLQAGYETVKNSIQILTKGLSQQKQKIEREVSFKSNMGATQQEINEQIKKRRQVEDKYVRQSQIKKASQSFPLEYHAQLIHYALQIKSTKILTELIQAAKIRIQCRRIQVPYVNDIMVVVSNSPYPNVPNGYTKIPLDLNQANMMKELIKLRKSGKKPPEDQVLKAPANVPAGKDEKKDNKKGGKQVQAQPPAGNKQNDNNREPTQWQLNQIRHKYVFMMIKKSMSPQDALYDLTVVLGNQQKGPVGYIDNRRIIVPYIQQNMKIMESEINQHTGVQQTTGMVPYLILYHSRNGLQSDLQKKTVITDVTPLIGKNPMVPAKWGYKKIETDLRQVPIQFIKAPNHDYVYLTFKTDELFHISQRHIQIIKSFVELESTYGQKKGVNTEEQKYIELQVNYDIEKLDLFFQTIQQALKGELGRQYYQKKSDFLTNLTLQIWTKYLKNPLLQFDYMREQRLNGEIIDYDYEFYKAILQKCSPVFLRGLKVMNLIMVSNPKGDILLQSKINLQLSKLLQQSKAYKIAADNIKLGLDKLRKYRDQYLSKGVEGSIDKILPFSITCSNSQIKNTIQQMRKRYAQQRRFLQKVLRIRDRKAKDLKALSAEQLQQQQKQFIRLRKPDNFDQMIQKLNTNHTQVYAIICAIQLDLLNIYFRVSLKRSEELTKLENSKNDMTNGIRNTQIQGLATTLKQKLNLANGPTQTKNLKNLSQLQNTLVKANQLPTPKPKLQRMQNKLIAQNKKNPYSMALLMINLAAMNSENNDKRYYLQQALNYIHQCKQLEQSMLSKAVQNAIFIFSGLWDNKTFQDQTSQKILPFRDLYNNIWQNQTVTPQPPILISKNSTSIHLKLPPYIPKKRHEKQQARIVKYMSIYGKPSANGVDVSLNCTQLEGTGIRKEVGKTIKISSLNPNNVYCFAAAGVDQNEQVLGIGKTGEDIGAFNPLSISMIASYLAKVSYQINQYSIAQKAVAIVLNQYCIQGSYLTTDERLNNLYYYTINQARIKGVSLIEIKSIAESFYIAALCQRRIINQMMESDPNKPKIVFQEKQKLITNLLMLSASLAPSLSSPNLSIPFLIPENQVLLRSIALNMIPQKWMSPKVRKLGVYVMQKLLKWGLQNNQINLSRKLAYKWNERKYLIMGKMIQIQQKKQVKKGAKDSKDQQVKLIDKYCRIMIEKSPHMMDAFQDSMIMISQEYYDYVGLFIQRAKDQINAMSQFVDNPTEEIDSISNSLNLKLQLLQYLKEPLQSIKKIGNTSPYYLQYNSKILKKALEVASQNQYKTILLKSQELDIPEITEEIKLSRDIYELIFSAIKEDISWNPTSKLQLIQFQRNTGKDLNKAIQIFTSWQQKKLQLTSKLKKNVTLQAKHKDFDYINMWISELYHQKAQCHVITSCNDFNVKRKIKVRYDKIRAMNLQDLFKKQKQVLVLQDKSYAYTQEQLKKITQILAYLSQSIYASLVVQNWLKLDSILKFLCNFLCYIQITPFYHKGTQLWTYFTFISLCTIQMLTKIKKNGIGQFRRRYGQKLMNTQRANLNEKLQLGEINAESLVQEFIAEYYQPDLDSNTTKSFWFLGVKQIDIQAISSVIAYTVNTLRLQNKHNLVINIVRDFCNVTQHYYSLMLLPFMTSSQAKLLEDVQKMIQKQSGDLLDVQNIYNAEKQKMGKKRAYLMSGQKMQFQKVYEQKSEKINASLKFLNNQKKYIDYQIIKSNKIKDQIARDTSKQVLAQQQQKKYTIQFGEDYEQMYRKFGEEAKHVKKSKNFIKDIINKYDIIYQQLKNNKTSKDLLAQIQNRNQVGNLWFATGNLQKAYEFWNDSLATIFKKVNPIDNYHQILAQNKPYLVKNIGDKQTILAICLLYKISNFACGHQLQTQKASTNFVCHLAFSIFQTSLSYPQTYQMYKDFRIKNFPIRELFADENTINLTQLLQALEYFILKNLYDQNTLLALPLATFYEYIGTDVVKNTQISIKAKIYKSMLLSESGFISESIYYLTKAANDKDLPNLWMDSSDFLKKEKGINWVQQGPSFNHSQLWNQNQNKIVIEQFKKLNLKPQTALQNGIINPILFNYAKSLALFKIYENELSKDQVLNDQRLQALNEVQVTMRQNLKKCAILEQFYSLLEQYQNSQLLYRQNEVSDELKKAMENCKAKMIQYLKKNGVQEPAIKIYQRQQNNSLKRSHRLQLMLKIRFSLYKVSESRNLLTNCFFILKNGISNVQRYAFGARLCQTGYDPQIKTVVVAVPQPGKKDDKKGGKKEEENPQAVAAIPIDNQKQKQIRLKSEGKLNRTALNAYWHIKILFQLGKILFKQNNFRQSIKIFEVLIQNSKKFQEEYFSLFSRGFIARARLRLGVFQPQQFKQIISQVQRKQFYDVNYINLVMDFGQLLSGDLASLQFLQKGKRQAERLWKLYGMKSVLNGIDQAAPIRNYYLKQQVTAQQQQAIKKKKKGEKKGGKDQKKAPPKKQDPKKKKQQSKVQYKINPLSKLTQPSVLQQQKFIFGQYNLTPHPNYRKNNIYQSYAFIYIKIYIRLLKEEIALKRQKNFIVEIDFVLKLLKIIQSYPFSTEHIKIVLYSCLGKVYKHSFISQLQKLLKETKQNYLNMVKKPFQDLPLNKMLINIPTYSEFLSQNRKLLLNAKTYFKKSLTLVENSTIFYERSFNLQDIVWQYADNQCLLAEYVGRDKPKFYPEDQIAINVDESKLQCLNSIVQSAGYLEFAIKIRSIILDLSRNYLQIGGKGFDPNAKIDEDINSEIMQIDKQSKKTYPQFLIDAFKGKGPINGTDLITYMLKIYRQAEFMTFSNPNYQNIIYKCHRILVKFLQGYKEKCLINSLDVPLKKTLKDKFIQVDTIIIKSVRVCQNQTLLYIVGPSNEGQQIYYGRVTIELHTLSKFTEDLLNLTTKMSLSDKRSQAVKNRDYILHRRQFKRILIELSVRYGNTVVDGNIKPIGDEFLPQLTVDNLKIINKMLDISGLSAKNKQVCKYLRKLHEIKYL